jgi:hypothetical protein
VTPLAVALSLWLSTNNGGHLHINGLVEIRPVNDLVCADHAQDIRWKLEENDFFIWCEDRKL